MGTYSQATCHGEHSIQNEINNIIRHMDCWQTKIRDKQLRESIRRELQTQHDEWCDYKANTCFCSQDEANNPFNRKGIL